MSTKTAKGVAEKEKLTGRKLASKILVDFAQNTGLQGLRYIAEHGVSFIERLIWAVIFIAFTIISCVLINNVWIKWNTSPIIVSFNERTVSVREIPFPSVTVCPQVKSMATIFNFTEFMEKIEAVQDGQDFSEQEKADFIRGDDIALVCGDESFYKPVINRTYSDSSLVENLIEVAPSVNDTFIFCAWKNINVNCEDIFKIVLTNEGVCYNFNALSSDEIFRKSNIQKEYQYLETEQKSKHWEMQKGYTKGYDANSYYPRRASENSAQPDLDIVLKESDIERDPMCNGMHGGFKVYIQHPAEMPQSSLYYYAALRHQVSTLALDFTLTMTSEDLADYPADVRKCYFPEDRKLRYFNLYNAHNCMMECLSNYTYQYCGCVPYHFPHNDSRHICTFQSYTCVNEAYESLRSDEGVFGIDACKCYPDCYSISYDAEILKTEFKLAQYVQSYSQITNEMPNIEGKIAFSRIEFFFKKPRYPAVKRSEIFGATDFLSNIGGLLGLFLGFSFITCVEIIYFISIRLGCEIKRQMDKENNESRDSER